VVLEVIKRLFGRAGGAGRITWDYEAPRIEGGVEPVIDYDEVVAGLEVKKMELERMLNMVVGEVKDMYPRIVEALKSGDRESAELLAAEAAMKNTLVKALAMVSRLLQLAISKVRTAKSVEELARILGPVVVMLRNINEYIGSTAPEIAAHLSAIKDEIERLYAIPGLNTEYLRVKGVTDLVPESRELLRRAYEEASREVEKLLPPPPTEVTVVNVEELQEKLLDYIKRQGGRISIKKAAEDLRVPPELVRKALFALEEKGLIKLHGVKKPQAASQ